ncbi:MAG: hypothetical protein L0L92_06560, partial [Corynebacterium variabile]|nr:hypothetical protein [Corynebacterium variabile]
MLRAGAVFGDGDAGVGRRVGEHRDGAVEGVPQVGGGVPAGDEAPLPGPLREPGAGHRRRHGRVTVGVDGD